MIDAILDVVGPWWFVLAIIVAVFGVGRWARLVTYDIFPPAIKFRVWWENKVKERHPLWVALFQCPHCFGFWLALICGAWFALGWLGPYYGFLGPFFAWSWWIFWGWGALAYLATYVITYDGAKDE